MHSLRKEQYKESCGFLVRLSEFNPKMLDRIYHNRKLLMIPQQLASLISDPNRMKKIRLFTEYMMRKTSVNSISKHLSEYLDGRVKLVLHDVVNFSVDGDSLDDIVKLSHFFR